MIYAHGVHLDIMIAAFEVYYRNVLWLQSSNSVTSCHTDAVDDKVAMCFCDYLPSF